MNVSEITPNMRFGKLKVIRKMDDTYKLDVSTLEEEEPRFEQVPYFECQCNCGKTCDIRGDLLLKNIIISCGCNMLQDNIAALKDILIQYEVNFKEDYAVPDTKIRSFHFGILDNNNQLLGLIDIRPDNYLTRIGNEEKNRVEQRKTIYNEKQEYCLNNEIKYLIISALPVFYINWDNAQLSWKEICNQTWQRVKNQINETFNIDENIHWYTEESN